MSSTFAPTDPETLRADAAPSPLLDPRGDAPIRAELFGLDRLEILARQLATAGRVDPRDRTGDLILRRFAENGTALVRTVRRINAEAARPEGRGIDADWLADNFHIVEDALREIKQDLPSGYASELPRLGVEPARGYPRVYALALSLVAHTDSELDEGRIGRFLHAFQTAAPLRIGEVWAVPTMLRLVLIENLRRLADRMVRAWDAAAAVDAWASTYLPAPAEGEDDADAPAAPVSASAAPFPTLDEPTVVRLVQRLRERGPAAAPVLARLEEELARQGKDANRVLRDEHRRQAANQVSVSNCVISLRLLSVIDWNVFFEKQSAVEVILQKDPSGVYPRQDFATRDRYRRTVEKIARRSDVAEEEVARRAVALAEENAAQGPAQGHVGFYLDDRGLATLRRSFRYRATLGERVFDFTMAHPKFVYFGSVLALMALLYAIALGVEDVTATGASGVGLLILTVLALLLPASDVAVGLVNNLATLLLPPRKLARLDFKAGIPSDVAAMVVVPSMLTRPDSAAQLTERLEITYLANPDPSLKFALLTDFADAPEEHRPEDEAFVRSALDAIAALNARYAEDGETKFFLFHRHRTWNPVQDRWMGWERKRGKLSEFNRMIRGDRGTTYSTVSADPALLAGIKYIITLDADTILPRESARRLVGTIAHPLNAPVYDAKQGRVVQGHGVLQPRVSYHLYAATRSRFAGLLAASGGIDPYSNAVSDTYMDLFGLGTFTGKGVYDLDAFEAAVGETFPENAILSHDLIEGNFARCGLVTDVELFDDFPPRYHAYAMREHRWARGDWQLLPWLGRTIPTSHGTKRNPLPLVERWKVFDNLRRSLVPASLVALLVLGWTVLPGSPWIYTFFALMVPALPIVQTLLGASYGSIKQRSLGGLLGVGHSMPATIGQSALWIAFLADQARRLIDAIARTLHRLFVSHRNLLEWETAAATEHRLGTGIGNFVRAMWPSSAFALAVGGLVAYVRPGALPAAVPVLAAWFLAPLVAYWISRPVRVKELPLDDAERGEIRRIARKTWHFFETFVGDEDHWLPPDNYMEDSIGSGGRVAHRTSPTNKGMLLLSTLAAHDFGYLSLRTLAERLHKTFDTFDRMEKYRGHLYNWYNTQTLQTLPPNYVSTVDSGNLLGCLVTLKQGMREKVREVIPGPNAVNGLLDTLAMLLEDVHQNKPRNAGQEYFEFDKLIYDIRNSQNRCENLLGWHQWLTTLTPQADRLIDLMGRLPGVAPGLSERWVGYAARFTALIDEQLEELDAIAPWVKLLQAESPETFDIARSPHSAWGDFRWNYGSEGTLVELAARAQEVITSAETLSAGGDTERLRSAYKAIAEAARRSQAAAIVAECERLGERAATMADEMDFGFLYKEDRHLFSIGQNMVVGRLDASCYDLMASEACLSSFLAVARGDAPRRHWFQLGRPYIHAAGRVGLMSWGGSCFEYLMPRLMMLPLRGTLLDTAHRTAVARQMEYGRQQGIPWGISESAYAAYTPDGDYHYQSFGTPGLGLKRDIGNDLVIAPYATALAVAVEPRAALQNFRQLTKDGGEGRYGYYEAVDFTPGRVPQGRRSAPVREYMAHHHGMSLVAMANALLDEPMPRRFHAEPMIKAVDLLLQERIPHDPPLIEPSESEAHSAAAAAPGEEASPKQAGVPLMSRRLSTPHTPMPRTHLLANGQYNVMVTNSGAGYSVCRGLDVTRWRDDSTLDNSGQFVYIRDVATNHVWSAAHQPTGRPADHYEAIFSADKVAFRRLDGAIEALTEITVSPEARVEVRRVTLTNHDTRPRDLELTSYAEVVLLPHAADTSHPAFGKLFLETEWASAPEAILARRRPRQADQAPVWAVHVAAVDGGRPVDGTAPSLQFETDRARFLGRGRTLAAPLALDPGAVLSGTTGAVLDPVFSIRRRVRVEAGTSATVAFTTAVADSREEALTLADHYREIAAVGRGFELAWAHSQVEHQARHWSAQDAHAFQRLGSSLLYAGTAHRAPESVLVNNTKGQPGLWAYGISGDKPIVLLTVADFDQTGIVPQLLTAHTFLRLKGLEFDLVLLVGNGANAEADDDLLGLVLDQARNGDTRDRIDQRGGVFARKLAAVPPEDQALLRAYARVVLSGDGGSLGAQLDRPERAVAEAVPFAPAAGAARPDAGPTASPPTDPLRFDNGTGGFTADGREYVIRIPALPKPDALRNGRPDPQNLERPSLPPAPWVNVVANPNAGFVASETGGGYTWASNSQTNRLTPWTNDPVGDAPGEVIYLRDESSGDVWCPTPGPIPSGEATLVRHGHGYTVFERVVAGLRHELTLLVPPTDPVKVVRLRVTNNGPATRDLSATYYAEWVLGTTREAAAMQVITEAGEGGMILARNPMGGDYAGAVAFLDSSRANRSVTASRAEFLGRNGSHAAPAGLARAALSGTVGAGFDPCGAIMVPLSVEAGATEDVIFVLGQGLDRAEAARLAAAHRDPGAFDATLAAVRGRWDATLGAVEVETPDPSMDVVLNGWLLYQALSCRFWGRSATYQSGGAYGYRDQLQDSMALVYGAPAEAKAQILRAAGRQFAEGDVQHWWHPPLGRGIRTRISDDLIWLPYVVSHYLTTTGDGTILDEPVPFLDAPELKPGQEDSYGLPAVGPTGTVYEHCTRALDRAYRLGPHGLPLMGTGDWNDGMNRVGDRGKGESVWNAWFLVATLRAFEAVAEARGDAERANTCHDHAEALRAAIEANAWDGAWYLRAFFDNGTPLGSKALDECRIDSIPQSWATISGAADPERARQALAAVDEQLVRDDDGVVLLFRPPFDRGKLQPGYVRGYVPGVRENGGQYTHAATWLVLANALAGRGDRAVELFDLLNPVRHALDADAVARYKVEPYVVAADIYGRPPHTGRGGWTWYTGSASWLYRVGVEAILGFHLRGDHFEVDPRIAAAWPGFTLRYRHGSSRYVVRVENPNHIQSGVASATLDGQPVDHRRIPLADDGGEHAVAIVMG